jgi:hypothetical protein
METRSHRFRCVIGAILAVVLAVVPLVVAVKRPSVQVKVGAGAQPDSPPETSTERPADNVLGVVLVQPAAKQSSTRRAIAYGEPHARRQAIEYDKRSFAQMGDAWLKETDDPEWSLNVKTFVGAMIETLDERADAQSLEGLSVRCRHTVCRLDVETADVMTFAKVERLSRQQQSHVTYNLSRSDAGTQIEAYLGRERGAPTDEQ